MKFQRLKDSAKSKAGNADNEVGAQNSTSRQKKTPKTSEVAGAVSSSASASSSSSVAAPKAAASSAPASAPASASVPVAITGKISSYNEPIYLRYFPNKMVPYLIHLFYFLPPFR